MNIEIVQQVVLNMQGFFESFIRDISKKLGIILRINTTN
jgi:hypothetical protein